MLILVGEITWKVACKLRERAGETRGGKRYREFAGVASSQEHSGETDGGLKGQVGGHLCCPHLSLLSCLWSALPLQMTLSPGTVIWRAKGVSVCVGCCSSNTDTTLWGVRCVLQSQLCVRCHLVSRKSTPHLTLSKAQLGGRMESLALFSFWLLRKHKFKNYFKPVAMECFFRMFPSSCDVSH